MLTIQVIFQQLCLLIIETPFPDILNAGFHRILKSANDGHLE